MEAVGRSAPATGVTTSGPGYAPLRIARTGTVGNTWTCRREGNASPNSEESGMEIKTWGFRAASAVGVVAVLSVVAARLHSPTNVSELVCSVGQ